MWCILRCHSGYEKKVVESCRRYLSAQHLSEQCLLDQQLFTQQLSTQHLPEQRLSEQRLLDQRLSAQHLSGSDSSGQLISDAFIFTYDRMKRYEGAWHLESEVLFPGCVFLEIAGDGLANTDKSVKPDAITHFVNQVKVFVNQAKDVDRCSSGLEEVEKQEVKKQEVKNQDAMMQNVSREEQGTIESVAPEIELVHPELETFLRKMCGEDHHLKMSEGYIRDGITHVTSGPLVGMERFIRKIDRHKRTARVVTLSDMLMPSLTVGLEIVSKT